MSVTHLLKAVDRDTEGVETTLRIIGTREPPAKMIVQIAIAGAASVRIQGRIARDAPWQDVGPAHTAPAIVHIDAVQFLRALASNVAAKSSVTVWAVWAW
jgi:hypothetical protein